MRGPGRKGEGALWKPPWILGCAFAGGLAAGAAGLAGAVVLGPAGAGMLAAAGGLAGSALAARLLAADLALLARRLEDAAAGEIRIEPLSCRWREAARAGEAVTRTLTRLADVMVAVQCQADELRAARDELARAATTDPLTGLANRRAFFERAPLVIDLCARLGRPAAVALFDLDHFKEVNDRYGHAAGDAVLAEFAARLQRSVRRSDLPARLGGEEFAVLLPCADGLVAAYVAERVRAAVAARPFTAGGTPFAVTVTAGVAPVTPAGLEAALRAADAALYRGKRAGRNRVETATEEEVLRSHDRSDHPCDLG